MNVQDLLAGTMTKRQLAVIIDDLRKVFVEYVA